MLRQHIVLSALLLLLASSISDVFAGGEGATQAAARQTVESYCKIEFDGAWVPDRWAIIKFSPKRKAEREFWEILDSAVFQLESYPFIVISTYDIQEVNLNNPDHATAKVVYSQVAHSVSNTGSDWRHWHLVAEPIHDETVTLNLIFDKSKWWVLDPPTPRISKQKLIDYYETKRKEIADDGSPLGRRSIQILTFFKSL